MWDRIFFLLLAVCSAIMAALTYYAWSWLQSIGAPAATVEGYSYHAGFAWKFVWISSIILLILANFLLARFKRSWAMWATFVYFAAFIIIRYFFLERSLFHYKLNTGLAEPGLSWAPLAGAIIVVVAAAIVFVDQMLVVRLTERIYPTAAEVEIPVADDEEPSPEPNSDSA
ncbi:MAG: hypothetical protein AAB288_04595 [Acidobacteriota bacterium]